MLINRFILTILSAAHLFTAATGAQAAQNIISTGGPVIQKLSHNWYGQAAAKPIIYSFSVEDDCLVFHAAQNAPVTIHPDARPGKFQEELWKYDTAEFFIADADGKNYMEFNLCPNGAWWACAFDAPRQQMPEAGVPEGVETTGSVTELGWACSARVPLEYLSSLGIDINNCRLATTAILNSPDYKYYTTANDLSGEPDFHLPDDWSGALVQNTPAAPQTMNLSRNQAIFYSMMQDMNAAGDSPEALKWLTSLSDAAQLEAVIGALSGQEYATAMSSQLEGNLGHLRRLRGAMGKGSVLGNCAHRAAEDSKGAALAEPTEATRWRAGVTACHEETQVNTDARGTGYDRSESGAMLSAEYRLCKSLTLGGAISYGRATLRTDRAPRRHEDNTRLDIYALYVRERWQFATSVGVGIHDHELKRRLCGTGSTGYSINFLQDAAYTVHSNEERAVQLFGTVESSWNHIDNFRDAMLSGDSQHAWATDLTAGVRYSHALPAICRQAPAGVFTAQAGVTASIGDIKSGLDLSMNGYSWRQESATRNRWGWNLSAGVDVPVSDNMSVFGAAEAVLRGDSNSLDGQIGVRISF